VFAHVLDQGAKEAEVDDDEGVDYDDSEGGEGADNDDKHVADFIRPKC